MYKFAFELLRLSGVLSALNYSEILAGFRQCAPTSQLPERVDFYAKAFNFSQSHVRDASRSKVRHAGKVDGCGKTL